MVRVADSKCVVAGTQWVPSIGTADLLYQQTINNDIGYVINDKKHGAFCTRNRRLIRVICVPPHSQRRNVGFMATLRIVIITAGLAIGATKYEPVDRLGARDGL